jgi:hypothetical protein
VEEFVSEMGDMEEFVSEMVFFAGIFFAIPFFLQYLIFIGIGNGDVGFFTVFFLPWGGATLTIALGIF